MENVTLGLCRRATFSNHISTSHSLQCIICLYDDDDEDDEDDEDEKAAVTG